MADIRTYKDLIAWQKGMDLVEAVYCISAGFPALERFGLSAQIRRAAVSIPANIAEGYGRTTRADYVRFLDIARGSANEVETQLLISARLKYVTRERMKDTLAACNEVQRILTGLVRKLQASTQTSIRD